ncbi:Flavin-dependent L-tryptophan oxidase RebO [Bdellovibrio bacteriovorus]|uniref:flavin monoamine oxidase family protein n=1 Tax=Bdellovibrio bacteriovorus TaxID=959 RepID=UPI000A781FE9|nr:NAD(P)/FAD-dependent oxidoreductase [Bdellovibrio bacteriovorus]BEV68932.1 Flavin-dependent L-tryptophan oxidase RebO [Bdellovibrio bacteriovorus]
MAKSSFTRREFLKISALGSSALAWGGCASAERFFMGDARDLRSEVVILGAGAAGLAAAFELKKKKIPFRIFEASSRVGGRVQSVPVFGDSGPVGELGAEFFDNSHVQLLSLAKELNLPVREIKTPTDVEAHLFSFDGKQYRVKDLLPRMKSLQTPLRRVRLDLYRDQDVVLSYKNAFQYERAAYYDTLSLKDLLESWSSEVDPVLRQLIEVQAVSRFGLDAADQSSLHFLSTVDAEGSSLLGARTTYRMEGGLSNLMQTLASRVAGVIPDYSVKMNMALVEMSFENETFELIFQGPQGKETFRTRSVICTIPFSKLREVKGFMDLDISSLKKEAVRTQEYATHSKGLIPFAAPFWKNRSGSTPANLGNFTGDFTSEKIWDSGRSQPGTQGLLTWQRGGSAGLKAGASATEDTMKDLGLFYGEVPSKFNGRDQMVNWKQRKWSLGSMAVFKPGQYMKYRGAAGEPELNGQLLFAGEHTSLRFAGTLQGAIETGQKAAAAVTLG